VTRFIGIDLAWGEGSATKAANETGLVVLERSGRIAEAGWARGIEQVVAWLESHATDGDVIAIDAPLVVTNASGMRECEREVGQRYGAWQVFANPSNLAGSWSAGITLRHRLEALGFVYSDGLRDISSDAISFFECYPYTTLVGAYEFGYDVERPRYKRFNRTLALAERRAFRAKECDELIRRTSSLVGAEPRMDLSSHVETARLASEPSPLPGTPYKHREDLLDAAICVWTAALWSGYGEERCQILGRSSAPDDQGRHPVIIAPATPEQRAGSRRQRNPTATAPVIAQFGGID